MVKIALICSILAVTAVSAQQTMSEGDSCNESLPPRYAKRCDRDQGLVCRTVSMVMGASGKCVKGGSISRNTIKLGGRCSTSRTRGNRGRITPCESGAVCKITNKGNMRVDRPNSGLCVAKRGGGKNRGSYNDGSNNDNPSLGGHKGNSGVGAKCVKGFSEKGISMPCKFGLKCVATAQFCAGTCYGTCQGGGH